MNIMNLSMSPFFSGLILNTLIHLVLASLAGALLLIAIRKRSAPLRSMLSINIITALLLVAMLSPVLFCTGKTLVNVGVFSLDKDPALSADASKTPIISMPVKRSANTAPVKKSANANPVKKLNFGQKKFKEKTAAKATIPVAGFKPSVVKSAQSESWFSKFDLLIFINISGVIWILGTVIMLGRLAHGLVFLSGFRSGLCKLEDKRLESILCSIKNTFPGNRRMEIYTSPSIISPVATGIIRPIVILPEKLYETVTDVELKSIIIHEAAHIYHLDPIANLLQRFVVALNWWNPLVFQISRICSVAKEEICDNYAIQEMESAHLYSECLINLAEKACLISTLPATAGMAGKYIGLNQRITNILSKGRKMNTKMNKSSKVAGITLMALLSVLIAGCGIFNAENKETVNGEKNGIAAKIENETPLIKVYVHHSNNNIPFVVICKSGEKVKFLAMEGRRELQVIPTISDDKEKINLKFQIRDIKENTIIEEFGISHDDGGVTVVVDEELGNSICGIASLLINKDGSVFRDIIKDKDGKNTNESIIRKLRGTVKAIKEASQKQTLEEKAESKKDSKKPKASNEPSTNNDSINFPDKVLADRLRRILGKKPQDPIRKSDVSHIEELNLSSEYITDSDEITNIEGIQYFKNLKKLNLYYNKIKDISPIQNLVHLKSINFWANEVESISPLKNLKLLEYVNLGANNKITDISVFTELPNLATVWLNYCPNISNISILGNCSKSIFCLGISGCNVKDISFTKNLPNLSDVFMQDNFITDISSLAAHEKIIALYLENNQIRDISVLLKMYNNGCFKRKGGDNSGNNIDIELSNNRINTTPDSMSRLIIDHLINENVGIRVNKIGVQPKEKLPAKTQKKIL